VPLLLLQAVALCLDDPVQFRLQWPTAPMLKLGNRQLKVVQRAATTALGPLAVSKGGSTGAFGGIKRVVGGASGSLISAHHDVQECWCWLPFVWLGQTLPQ
jgi:hypothetical protein